MLKDNEPNFSPNQEIPGEKATYRVIKNLGGGAYARPYLVENTKDQVRAILKFNTKVDEAEIVRLVHQTFTDRGEAPLVVDVLDIPQTKYSGWFGHIESLAEGKVCSENKPSELQSLQIALDFARTLKYCAMKGVAYLDVKPLTHIFWWSDKGISRPVIKVIDWNAGSKDASFNELRKDVVEFCKSLPEFFTGQEIQKFKVHPLCWNFDASVNSQLPVAYATWILLASLSLDWAGPTIPELRDVLQLPNSNTNTKDVKIIIDAWDSIIKQIQDTIDRYENPGSREFVPEYSPSPRPKPQKGFESISDALKTKDSDWPSALIVEMNALANEITQWLGENKDFITVNRSDDEPAFLALRFLSPGDQQYALLLSAFEIWKNAAYISSVESDPDWKKFIQAILVSDFDQLKLIIQNTLPLMKEKIKTRSTDKEYAGEWINKLNSLEEEIDIWIVLNIGPVDEVMGLSGSHPIVKNKQREIKVHQKKNEVFEKHLLNLKDAYNNADFQGINTIFLAIGNDLKSFSPAQMGELNFYRDISTLFMTIHATANSWDQVDLIKFDALYTSLPNDIREILKKYEKVVSDKQALLSELASWYLTVNTKFSLDDMASLDLGKYQAAIETAQYLKLKKALENWAEKQYDELTLRVSIGLKENKLDAELITNLLDQVNNFLKFAKDVSLAGPVSKLEVLKQILEDEEVGIDRLTNQLEVYYLARKGIQSKTQTIDGVQKTPSRIIDLIQADSDQNNKYIEDIINDALSSAYTEMKNKLDGISDHLLSAISQTDNNIREAERKLENILIRPLWTFLVPTFTSALSIIMLVIIFILTSNRMSEINKDIKSLVDKQSTSMVDTAVTPATPATTVVSVASELEQSVSATAIPSAVNINPNIPGNNYAPFSPFQLGTLILRDKISPSLKFYFIPDKNNINVLFRTDQGVTSANLYQIEFSPDNTYIHVGLFAFIKDKDVSDPESSKYTIKNSIQLNYPDDHEKAFLVVVTPPLEAIPISSDPDLAGHIIWIQGWIEK